MFEHEPLSAEYAQRVIDERCEAVRRKMIDECPKEWRTYVISRVAVHRRQVALAASQGGHRYADAPPRAPRPGRYLSPPNPGIAVSAIAGIRASLKPEKEVHP